MKRTMFLTSVGCLILALAAPAAPQKGHAKSGKRGAQPHAVAAKSGNHAVRQSKAVRASRSQAVARSHQARVMPSHQARTANANTKVHGRNAARVTRERNVVRSQREAVTRDRGVTARERNADRVRATDRNGVAAQDANARRAIDAQRADRALNRADTRAIVARTRSAPIVNNWRGERFSSQDYAAFRDYRRQWHDRNWWHSHYTRIILVSGGWWYWNAGYWYPAWGYDPYYTYYPYDGPIYGYGDLTPDRVIINVQAQLRDDGYYVGAVDGVLGPQTRRAIAAFQADHGLAVTSAVDEPTLATLGLT